jgi:2-oxo-4-hydroxy-4-carboxy-5-ureidoimidazoline decarboxylase
MEAGRGSGLTDLNGARRARERSMGTDVVDVVDIEAAGPAVEARPPLDRLRLFNALRPAEAERALAACCASKRWVAGLALSRPFATVGELYGAAAVHLAALDWPGVLEALAAHPRIGERTAGSAHAAAWSRTEQSAALSADARTAADLAAANVAYEAKFGYVFLIRATGRTAGQLLDAALDRLDHDELTEQAVVRGELGQIVRLRLDRMLADLAADHSPSTATGPR